MTILLIVLTLRVGRALGHLAHAIQGYEYEYGNKKRTVSIRVEAGCPCVTTSAWTTDGFHIPGRSCEHAHVRGQTAVPVAYVVLQRQVVERPQRRLAPIVSLVRRHHPFLRQRLQTSRGCRRAELAVGLLRLTHCRCEMDTNTAACKPRGTRRATPGGSTRSRMVARYIMCVQFT